MADLLTGLVAHYTMDAVSGTTLTDETGTNPGTITDATQVAGHIGQALNFAGSPQRVNLGTGSDFLFGSGAFSLSLWFKTTATSGVLLARWYPATGERSWQISLTSGKIRFQVSSDGAASTTLDSASTYNDGNWHHLVIVKNGTSATMTIDDTAAGSSSSIAGTAYAAASTPTHLGVYASSVGNLSTYYVGGLDAVRVYKGRALGSEDITALYTETPAVSGSATIVAAAAVASAAATHTPPITGSAAVSAAEAVAAGSGYGYHPVRQRGDHRAGCGGRGDRLGADWRR
jgi:hypothetical protein